MEGSNTTETIEMIETTTISPQFEMAKVASIMVQSILAKNKLNVPEVSTITPTGLLENLKEASEDLESLESNLNATISEHELKKEWQKTSKDFPQLF